MGNANGVPREEEVAPAQVEPDAETAEVRHDLPRKPTHVSETEQHPEQHDVHFKHPGSQDGPQNENDGRLPRRQNDRQAFYEQKCHYSG